MYIYTQFVTFLLYSFDFCAEAELASYHALARDELRQALSSRAGPSMSRKITTNIRHPTNTPRRDNRQGT